MKKILLVVLLIVTAFTGCESSSIGIIGGADGPTAVFVSKGGKKAEFGEQIEKTPVKMINVDGVLYYDSGLISDMTPRCGTLDGPLKKSAKAGEIPQENGEANFDAEGYQNATSITKEVNIDGSWHIFRRFSGEIKEGIKGLKYCFYIKGRLNKAVRDSELIVLTDNKNISFSQVYEPMLSSQYDAGKNNGKVVYDRVPSGDEWGIYLHAEDVTKSGLTLKIEQFGGNPTGELQTGEAFTLERNVEGEWQAVDTNPLDYGWHTIAYMIKANDITKLSVEWEWLYGKLTPGYYRINKEIMDFRSPGDFDEKIYTVSFTVE